MTLAFMAVIAGLLLLVWSADRFVDGAGAVARHLGMPPLLIGMVVVGFGTSAPEMVLSAVSATKGNVGFAIGNAYGSNISNIALILGIAALIRPISVESGILRRELPVLALVTCLAAWLMRDSDLSRFDAWALLGIFALLMAWTVREGLRSRADTLGGEVARELDAHPIPLPKASLMLGYGLVVLTASSQLLVWGADTVARAFGVSDLLIGLTVLAFGTSLPELASAVSASRKGEDDLALGNILGSNLFNTLAVVGIAGAIRPTAVNPQVIARDIPVMIVLTLSLFVLGYGFGKTAGRINRYEAGLLLAAYLAYVALLFASELQGS
jgi:cation:H+ antiporter